MSYYIDRNDVFDFVSATIGDPDDFNINGIVDTVIASIPGLIGEHRFERMPTNGVNGIIDSLIEDEDAYWRVVAEHDYTKDQVQVAMLAQLEREMDEACAVIAHAEAKAAAAERCLLKLRAEYDRTIAGTDVV